MTEYLFHGVFIIILVIWNMWNLTMGISIYNMGDKVFGTILSVVSIILIALSLALAIYNYYMFLTT